MDQREEIDVVKTDAEVSTNADKKVEPLPESKWAKGADFLFMGMIAIYIAVLIVLSIMISASARLRFFLYSLLDSNYQETTWEGLFSIGVIELILIMSGFDIFLVDMLVGFLVHPFHEAVLCLFIAKFVGKFGSFLIGRYFLKEEIYSVFYRHIFFKTFYNAAQKNPIQVLTLIQIITLPTIFKTYIIGAFSVSNTQYATITGISNLLWTAFFVHLGSSAKSLKIYLETGQTSDILPVSVQVSIAALCVFGVAYLFKLTQSVYKQMQNESESQSENIQNQ